MQINKFILVPILFFCLFFLNYSLAKDINQLKKKAKSGDTDAQYYLGKAYYDGDTIEQNYAKAFYWIRKSALGDVDIKEGEFDIEKANGDADAQFKLGEMYAMGEGVDGNYDMAVRWFVKAANSGSSDKQYDLAELYLSGEMIPIDVTQAFYWHGRAAEGGDRDSQYILGKMYRDGIGIEKNNQLALKWFSKAAEQGKKSAEDDLKQLKKDLLDEPADTGSLTADSQEQKQQDADKLLVAAKQGDAEAQYQLGKLYMQSKGNPTELIKAYKWLSLAADQGLIKALKLKTKVMQKLSSKNLIKAYKQVKNYRLSN